MSKEERDVYIDWLRTFAVHYVVFLHCIFTSDLLTLESQNNDVFKEKKDAYFRFLVQIGIPVFFFIAGMSSSHYKTEKNGYFKFLTAKLHRLMIPFFVSIIVFLLPKLYLS